MAKHRNSNRTGPAPDNPFKATKTDVAAIDSIDIKPRERVFRDESRTLERAQNFAHLAKHEREDELIEALDFQNSLRRILPIVKKLNDKKIDVSRACLEASNEALLVGLKMLFSNTTSEKVKADLLKHILGIGGFSPTQKLGIERLDPATPKAALIAMIAGSGGELGKEGIELVDDRDDQQTGDEDEDEDDDDVDDEDGGEGHFE